MRIYALQIFSKTKPQQLPAQVEVWLHMSGQPKIHNPHVEVVTCVYLKQK